MRDDFTSSLLYCFLIIGLVGYIDYVVDRYGADAVEHVVSAHDVSNGSSRHHHESHWYSPAPIILSCDDEQSDALQ